MRNWKAYMKRERIYKAIAILMSPLIITFVCMLIAGMGAMYLAECLTGTGAGSHTRIRKDAKVSDLYWIDDPKGMNKELA